MFSSMLKFLTPVVFFCGQPWVRVGTYAWNISCYACDDTTDRIPSHSNSINGSNHLLCVLRIWAPNNITLYLEMFHRVQTLIGQGGNQLIDDNKGKNGPVLALKQTKN